MPVVSEIMSNSFLTLDIDDTVGQAVEKLVSHGFCTAPVLHDGLMVGIVSELELFDVLFDTELRSATIAEVMKTEVISVVESEPVYRVACLFALHGIRRVPVVRDGKPIGVVSRRDLLRFSLEFDQSLRDPLEELMPFLDEEDSFTDESGAMTGMS